MKKYVVPFLVIILVAQASAAITFDTLKSSYGPGEVQFGVTVINPLTAATTITISALAYPEASPSALDFPPSFWEIELAPGASQHILVNGTIYDTAEAGRHLLSVEVSGDYSEYEEAAFTVTGTLKTFDATLVACVYPCESYSTVYLLNESPLISLLVLNGETATLRGSITDPNGGVSELSFFNGGASFPVITSGTYNVSVTASAQGYKTEEMELSVIVLEKLPEVTIYKPCNADGVCNGVETRQNCPMDCLPEEQGELVTAADANGTASDSVAASQGKKAGGLDMVWVLALVFVALIAIVFWNSRRKR